VTRIRGSPLKIYPGPLLTRSIAPIGGVVVSGRIYGLGNTLNSARAKRGTGRAASNILESLMHWIYYQDRGVYRAVYPGL
jgi:hypothetical protein